MLKAQKSMVAPIWIWTGRFDIFNWYIDHEMDAYKMAWHLEGRDLAVIGNISIVSIIFSPHHFISIIFHIDMSSFCTKSQTKNKNKMHLNVYFLFMKSK